MRLTTLALLLLPLLGALALPLPAHAAELESVFFANDQEHVEPAARATLRRAPADAEANAWLAEAHMKQGRWASAREALARAGEASLVGQLAHADFAWYTADYASARASYQAALAASPTNLHARWGLASSLLHLEELAPGLALARGLEAESSLEPDFHAWVSVLVASFRTPELATGNVINRLRVATEVKARLEAAAALSPKNPHAQMALGRFYLLAPVPYHDASRAIELLGRANDMDPYAYQAEAYLIAAYQQAKQPAKARVERAYFQAKFGELGGATAELGRIAP